MTEEVKKLYCNKLLDVFKRTIKFLEDNNIKWWAAYGTLIGAVRHNGLIPWDDDIDIWVPREDYNKLIKLGHLTSSYSLKLTSIETDRNYYLGFAKLSDINSTIWEHRVIPYVFGIYIDIFPIDRTDCSKEEIIEKTMVHNQHLTRQLDLVAEYGLKEYLSVIRHNAYKKLIFKWMNRNKKETIHEEFVKTLHTIRNDRNGDKMATLFETIEHPDYYNWSCFSQTIEIPFEDFMVKAPAGYHEILSLEYGDYMTPPPVSNRQSTHEKYYLNLKEGLTIDEVRSRLKKGEHIVF